MSLIDYSGVLYISTECKFASKRLQEIISRMRGRIHADEDGDDSCQSSTQVDLIDSTHFTDEIYVEYITTVVRYSQCYHSIA